MRQLKIVKQITNRETQSLDRYLTEIGKLELISADEEVNLTKRIRDGDEVALQKLTKANLRFVVSVAKQYQNNGLTLGDLINEGNFGLIKAAMRFDETLGFKFISYAVWWIRQSIMSALAEQSRVVRLPLNRVASIHRISRKSSELEQKFQREPSMEEIAEALESSSDEIADSVRISARHVSVNAPFTSDEENSLLNVLENDADSPDAGLVGDSLRKEIAHALGTLTARESSILTMCYGLGGEETLTLAEIGERLNLTRERVRQIRQAATDKLRRGDKCKVLRGYLG